MIKHFLLISLFLYSSTAPVFGQTFDLNQAYQDYLHTYNQYRQAQEEYSTAKTLAKTRQMLEKRSEVFRDYLVFTRLNLAKTTRIIDYPTNVLYMKLDKETDWLLGHKDNLSSASTKEELLKISSEFELKHPHTEFLIYQSLGKIVKAKEDNLYQKVNQLISETETKTLEIKEENKEESLIWEHWLAEVKNRAGESLQKQNEAKTILQGLEAKTQTNKEFHKAQFALKESNQSLKEVVFYLKEIIRKIKYD